MAAPLRNEDLPSDDLLSHVIRFCLENKLVVGLIVLLIIGWGLMVLRSIGIWAICPACQWRLMPFRISRRISRSSSLNGWDGLLRT
jgi:hypothetical protein